MRMWLPQGSKIGLQMWMIWKCHHISRRGWGGLVDKRGKGKHFNHLFSCKLYFEHNWYQKRKQIFRFGEHLKGQKNWPWCFGWSVHGSKCACFLLVVKYGGFQGGIVVVLHLDHLLEVAMGS